MTVSMMSTPASTAFSMDSADMPEVKWLCRWMGGLTAFFSAEISANAS